MSQTIIAAYPKPLPPMSSWWANPTFLADQPAFYLRAWIEAQRMSRGQVTTSYVLPIGDRGDDWKS